MTAIQSWLAPSNVSRSAQFYDTDPTFRHWLGVTAAFRRKHLDEIGNLAPRFILERPSKKLRVKVDFYIRSREVQWWHLHHEWMRKNGALASVPMDVRKASLFELWERWHTGGELPWELSAGRSCKESFEIFGELKSDGERWRTYFAFGVARRTRQKILHDALSAAGKMR
jgi:hypothetical protein